jgi:hypothetical protein
LGLTVIRSSRCIVDINTSQYTGYLFANYKPFKDLGGLCLKVTVIWEMTVTRLLTNKAPHPTSPEDLRFRGGAKSSPHPTSLEAVRFRGGLKTSPPPLNVLVVQGRAFGRMTPYF